MSSISVNRAVNFSLILIVLCLGALVGCGPQKLALSFKPSRVASTSDIKSLAAHVEKGMDALQVVQVLGNPDQLKKWGSRPGGAEWQYYGPSNAKGEAAQTIYITFKGHHVSGVNVL